MAYVKRLWVGTENPLVAEPGSTPITDERLNHLETQYDEAILATITAFQNHINDPAPHKAYDVDMPSLSLLFQNGIT